MCLGGGQQQQPAEPEITYQGPSQADLDANRRALDDYKASAEAQQALFATQLQQQISEAQAETARIQAKYDEEIASATTAAANAGVQEATDIYTVTAAQTAAPSAETTAAIKPKKNQRRSLKIATGNTANQAGSGLNIGL